MTKPSGGTTTCMRNHLTYKHKDHWEKLLGGEGSSKNTKMSNYMHKYKEWKRGSEKTNEFDQVLEIFLIKNNLPMQIVEDEMLKKVQKRLLKKKLRICL